MTGRQKVKGCAAWKPAGGQLPHALPREAVPLAALAKRAAPEVGHIMSER